ncbi:hypothetical protein DDI_2812 [Dickeya dianthicola RNS04.9]|nr:hypothetical protein DDI_2812 [Dickeya dianthicola RNS04.9]
MNVMMTRLWPFRQIGWRESNPLSGQAVYMAGTASRQQQ